MGNSASAPAASGGGQRQTLRPVLFGQGGEGAALAACVLHQRTGAITTDTIDIITRQYVSQYNAETGDRRMRVKPRLDSIACTAVVSDATAGAVLVLGGPNGAVLLHDALTLDLRKSVPKAGKPSPVTAIAAGSGKTLLVGYGDGTAVEVVTLTGARARAFPLAAAGAGTGKIQAGASPDKKAGGAGGDASAGSSPAGSPDKPAAGGAAAGVGAAAAAASGPAAVPIISSPVNALCYLSLAGGPMVAVAHSNGLLRLYDGNTGALIVSERLSLQPGTVLSLSFSPALQCLVGAEVAAPASISGTGVDLKAGAAAAGAAGSSASAAGGASTSTSKPGQRLWLWDVSTGSAAVSPRSADASAAASTSAAAGSGAGGTLELDVGPELASLGPAAKDAVATFLSLVDLAEGGAEGGAAGKRPRGPSSATAGGTAAPAADGTAAGAGGATPAPGPSGPAAAVLVGTQDGCVYVRRLARQAAPTEAGAASASASAASALPLTLSLSRVIKPSTAGAAKAGAPVTSMHHDSGADALLVGDAVGWARVVRSPLA